MTLEEAVDTALKGNRLLKLARLKIKEQEGKQQSAKSLFFPKVTNESNLLRIADRQSIPIPMGMLGVYPQHRADSGPADRHSTGRQDLVLRIHDVWAATEPAVQDSRRLPGGRDGHGHRIV